jgi:hypothetical protein
MTQLLSLGYVQAITQNVIYALPARQCQLFTDGTSPTIVQSTDVGFTANVAVVLTNGQMELTGGFIKCTSGDIRVFLKGA